MAHIVKNAENLGLSPAQLDTLGTRAALHRRYSNIDFKVVEVRPDAVVLLIRQGRSHAGNYFSVKRLIEILHETFGDLVSGRKIEPRPYAYAPAPPEVVTAEWLAQQRVGSKKKTKDIAHDLGLDPNVVSAYISGKKPLSGVVRAMFYYYFARVIFIVDNEIKTIPNPDMIITVSSQNKP